MPPLFVFLALSAIHGLPDSTIGRVAGIIKGIMFGAMFIAAGYERAQRKMEARRG